jgi:putative ABC transport system permease protein
MGAAQRKMTDADVTALEKKALSLEAVTGLVFGSATVKFEESTSNVSVFGSNDDFIRILNLRVQEGDFFSREEDDYGRRVAVLGAAVRTSLFGDENPLGRSIRMNETEFRIIGVMAPFGSKLGFNVDEFVFIPTTAALRLFNDDKLFGIRAKARSRASIEDAVAEISEILRERRDGEEDFTVLTQVAMMESMATILNMLTYVLGAIACISMLVGGIGIMNIMLVSVAERTPEIGIRRAVGARQRDIMKQFLAEAITLSVIGGVAGIILSVGLTYAIFLFVPSFDLRAPLWILPPAFLMSLIVGVVFGTWPARKASRIEILDALRYE